MKAPLRTVFTLSFLALIGVSGGSVLTKAATTPESPSLTEVVTEPQIRGENIPEPCDLSKGGCEASKHPNGPNCDPSQQFCDVGGSGGNFITRFRAEEVFQNNLVAFLLGGFQVFSPYWNKYEEEQGTSSKGIILNSLEKTSLAQTRRGLLDIVLRNLTLDALYTPGTSELNTDGINTIETAPLSMNKRTPGVFPIGYQYELSPDITSDLDTKRGACPTGDTVCASFYTPSLDRSIIPNPIEEGSYMNDIFTQYMSQKLKRILRLKPQSQCLTTDCQTAGHLTFFRAAGQGVNYFHAVTTCAIGGGRLPTSQELEVLVGEGYILDTTKIYTTDFVNHIILGSYPWQVYSIEPQSSGVKNPTNIDTMTHTDLRPLYCIVD